MRRFEISDVPLDIPALAASLQDSVSGALATFEGWVRDHNDGRSVRGLEYEIFAPLALAEADRILTEAESRFGVRGLRAVHRQGNLAIGECAVWVGATAPHRDEAFRACRYVIDEIKHRLPIWKKEHYVDGTAIWVNCQRCAAPSIAEDTHAHAHVHPYPAKPEGAPIDEAQFYARQLRLPEVGLEGQAKLRAARILIVGAGGLGAPASLMLAAAGVGTIGIAEFDRLEASNLHRQVLYAAADVGLPKADLAAARLRSLNPLIRINVHSGRVDAAGLPALLSGYDLVLDCTDNFATKFLLGDAAILLGKPVIQASVHRFGGQLLTIDRDSDGGCLRCLWPAPPPEGAIGNCAEVGVLGVVPGLFGTLQAAEALKRLLGLPGTLERHLLIVDALTFETRRITRRRDEACPLCGTHPSIRELRTEASPVEPFELDPAGLDRAALARFRVVDLREADERAEVPLTGALPVPFSVFDAKHPPFERDRPVLLVCARGRRSRTAAGQLRAEGWDAYSLIGGAASIGAIRSEAAE